MMHEIEEKHDFLLLPDGQELFYLRFSVQSSKGVLLIVHGLGEHCARYRSFARYLASKGWTVYLYDQRGHGKTPGLRAFVEEFQVLVEDLKIFIQHVRKCEKTAKIFLLGHSFGGQVVINFLAQYPREVKGAILSSPNIKLALQVPWLKRTLGRLASPFLPSLSVPNDINPKDISHDQKVVEDYRNDRLIHHKISLRLGSEMLENLEHLEDLAPKIKTPIFLFHGSGDRITCPEGTKDFYEKMRLKDRSLKIYPGFFHETLNEIGKERVYEDIEGWLNSKVS